ncbi:hypothetical protein E2C01_070760 [Portunus trituberculatus]|uniref:Uncharacterized protein n=1 Tax=Portunus trituberculatus TaxID=210409 RepID=A0A5B7HV16_PORTR|nr:hypothetical protein [Portunus trituberculatus]
MCVSCELAGRIPSLVLKQPAINGNPRISDVGNW